MLEYCLLRFVFPHNFLGVHYTSIALVSELNIGKPRIGIYQSSLHLFGGAFVQAVPVNHMLDLNAGGLYRADRPELQGIGILFASRSLLAGRM
jgi:hypothetical protein